MIGKTREFHRFINREKKTNVHGNYRPISVHSVVSKLFEKLVYQQMYSYLDNNELRTPFQSGFRKRNSTSTSLLNTTNT